MLTLIQCFFLCIHFIYFFIFTHCGCNPYSIFATALLTCPCPNSWGKEAYCTWQGKLQYFTMKAPFRISGIYRVSLQAVTFSFFSNVLFATATLSSSVLQWTCPISVPCILCLWCANKRLFEILCIYVICTGSTFIWSTGRTEEKSVEHVRFLCPLCLTFCLCPCVMQLLAFCTHHPINTAADWWTLQQLSAVQ